MSFGETPPSQIRSGDAALFGPTRLEALGRVAAALAHELNNQLTVINGHTDLLLGEIAATDPTRLRIEEIRRAGERAVGLIGDFLSAGGIPPQRTDTIDPHAVLEELRPTLIPLLGRSVELRMELTAADPRLSIGRRELEQIVLNLALNARDAMPAGGVLSIATADADVREKHCGRPRSSHAIELTVADTGFGMDEPTRLRAFEPFFSSKEKRGTGLGLSVVRDLVERDGGSVEVDSAPGAGSRFRISLPSRNRPLLVPARRATPTVLFVEVGKDTAFSNQLADLPNHRVLAAASVDSALEIAAREPIDLVVIPNDAPQAGLNDSVGRLRAAHPQLKAVFLSGALPVDDVARLIGEALEDQSPKARILIADDDGPVRSFLRAVLESAAYSVVEAADGADALRHARGGAVDLVITDLLMPDREGLETIRALRRECPKVPVVAISGAVRPVYLRMAGALGAALTLQKPIPPQSLLDAVADVLEQQRAK